MGNELAPETEWSQTAGLDWSLARDPERASFCHFVAELGRLYRAQASLWAGDHIDGGTDWIAVDDAGNSVLTFARYGGEKPLVVSCNFTPVPRTGYRVGAPHEGEWTLLMSSDDPAYGGSGFEIARHYRTEPVPCHGREHSLVLTCPPLAAVVLG